VSATTMKYTDNAGNAEFSVSGKGYYRIDVDKQGGFARARKCVELYDFQAPYLTAYVQLRLGFGDPPIVIH
jgi:hypothetical protein